MRLIDIYIQEVTRRLPEKNREDIARELRSSIEDMLPDDYTEDDVKSVLEKLGSPAALAYSYRDKPMYLIGPRYFDVYMTTLKMVLPIAVVVAFIAMMADQFIHFSSEEALINVFIKVIGLGISTILVASIQVLFWITLFFAIAERVDQSKNQQPLSTKLRQWTPDDLKDIEYIVKGKSISKIEVFGSLFWTAIWATLYFCSGRLVGVYEGGSEGLIFRMPVFNNDVLHSYWIMVVIIIALEISLAIIKLIKAQWSKKLALFNTLHELVSTIVFIAILGNPNLFNQAFISYMNELFNINLHNFGGVFWIMIMIFIITAVYNSYIGFKKAKL